MLCMLELEESIYGSPSLCVGTLASERSIYMRATSYTHLSTHVSLCPRAYTELHAYVR